MAQLLGVTSANNCRVNAPQGRRDIISLCVYYDLYGSCEPVLFPILSTNPEYAERDVTSGLSLKLLLSYFTTLGTTQLGACPICDANVVNYDPSVFNFN